MGSERLPVQGADPAANGRRCYDTLAKDPGPSAGELSKHRPMPWTAWDDSYVPLSPAEGEATATHTPTHLPPASNTPTVAFTQIPPPD